MGASGTYFPSMLCWQGRLPIGPGHCLLGCLDLRWKERQHESRVWRDTVVMGGRVTDSTHVCACTIVFAVGFPRHNCRNPKFKFTPLKSISHHTQQRQKCHPLCTARMSHMMPPDCARPQSSLPLARGYQDPHSDSHSQTGTGTLSYTI